MSFIVVGINLDTMPSSSGQNLTKVKELTSEEKINYVKSVNSTLKTLGEDSQFQKDLTLDVVKKLIRHWYIIIYTYSSNFSIHFFNTFPIRTDVERLNEKDLTQLKKDKAAISVIKKIEDLLKICTKGNIMVSALFSQIVDGFSELPNVYINQYLGDTAYGLYIKEVGHHVDFRVTSEPSFLMKCFIWGREDASDPKFSITKTVTRSILETIFFTIIFYYVMKNTTVFDSFVGKYKRGSMISPDEIQNPPSGLSDADVEF